MENRMRDEQDTTGGGRESGGGAASLRVAAMFLTRLPVRAPHAAVGGAVGAFPLVGLLVGSLGGAGFALAAAAGLPPLASALAALAATVLVTGALHEDGLADCADGLAGKGAEDSIRIMRDSHIGAYGVLALLFSVGLRIAALAAIAEPGAALRALVAAAILSRAAMPPVMLVLPRASADGLAASAGTPGRGGVAVAVAGGLLLAVVFAGPPAVPAILVAALAASAVAMLARRRLGGYTGDVLGAVQQAVETAVLLAIAATV